MSERLIRRRDSEGSGATLASTIAAQLRRQIVSGELVPGEKLRLEALREQFSVSLSPLREALKLLGSEGLLIIEDRHGYRVPPVSKEDLLKITKMRCQLEVFALRESIANGDLDWEAEIAASLHRLNRLQRNSKDEIADWEAEHRNFHRTLIAACAMPLMIQFCLVLHDHADRYRRLFLSRKPGDPKVPLEHSRIAEAATLRKPDLACELLEAHIKRAAANAREALSSLARQEVEPTQ